jgi:hypothetical protein
MYSFWHEKNLSTYTAQEHRYLTYKGIQRNHTSLAQPGFCKKLSWPCILAGDWSQTTTMAAARAGRVLRQQGGQLRGLLPVGSLFSGAQGCASWQMTIQFSPAVVGSTKAASISSLWRINSYVSSQGGAFSEPRKVKE